MKSLIRDKVTGVLSTRFVLNSEQEILQSVASEEHALKAG